MWPDRVLNPGPLSYESGALLTVLHGPAYSLPTNSLGSQCNIVETEGMTIQ